MVDRAYGVKQSNFTAQTSIVSGSYIGFFAGGYNYKITYDNFISGLGVTGTIVQDGAVTGVPVLDTQGTVNNIRNLEAGTGINIAVSAENGITISATQNADEYVSASSAYTATTLNYVIDCISGTFTVTLPTAAGITGQQFIIKNSGAGSITVDPDGSQTIDGSTTQVLSQYDSITIVSNGTNWIII
jgi:hypothetical protein